MGIIICPYCAEHLKKPVPVCPDCGRPQPERSGILDELAPPDDEDDRPVWQPPEPLPELPEIERGFLWNPRPLFSFVRAFLIVAGTIATAQLIDERAGHHHSDTVLLAAPVVGLATGLAFAAFGGVFAGMYEAVAGSEPLPLPLRDERRSGDAAPAPPDAQEGIRSSETKEAPMPLPSAIGEPPSLATPGVPPPRAMSPFYPTLFVVLAATFLLGLDSGKRASTAAAFLLFFGVPLGFFIAGLAVRSTRRPAGG